MSNIKKRQFRRFFSFIFLYGINIISNMAGEDGYVHLQLFIFFWQRPEEREEKRDRNSSG